MNLEWDINYEFSFNTYYPINLQIIFEIPIKEGRQVYMQHSLEFDSKGFIIILDTKKFIKIWRKSKNDSRIPNYHIGDEKLWRTDYKFHSAEQGFEDGKKNPVPVTAGIDCIGKFPNCNVSFNDGVTRTIWLLANGAEYFPIVVPDMDSAIIFQSNAGKDSCPIYSSTWLYEQWLDENENLLPITPK